MTPIVRSLFVAWQEPESRRIFPVARLSRRRSGEYELRYIGAVWAAREHGFLGLPGFEELEDIHVTPGLPELFAQRSAPRRRSAPADPSVLAGEQLDAAPITLFVRRQQGGPSERLEAFAPPLRAPDGRRWGVIEARGVGRSPGSAELPPTLVPGEALQLRPEPDNPYNPHALRILRADGSHVGYAPDYFVNELAAVGGRAEQIELSLSEVQRVTFAPAPIVYRVSCRYVCPLELGRALFTSDSYRPVSPRAQPSSNSAV
jgi:HIRAN domain